MLLSCFNSLGLEIQLQDRLSSPLRQREWTFLVLGKQDFFSSAYWTLEMLASNIMGFSQIERSMIEVYQSFVKPSTRTWYSENICTTNICKLVDPDHSNYLTNQHCVFLLTLTCFVLNSGILFQIIYLSTQTFMTFIEFSTVI